VILFLLGEDLGSVLVEFCLFVVLLFVLFVYFVVVLGCIEVGVYVV